MFLKQHDSAPYRDVILNCCLHNFAYDTQVEGVRASFMYEVLETVRNPSDREFCRARILEALAKVDADTKDNDIHQLFSLTRFFANDGDREARDLIYRKFKDKPALADFEPARHIVLLDKLDGFITAAEVIGKHFTLYGKEFVESGFRWGADRGLVYAFQVAIGDEDRENAKLQLEHIRNATPYIATFFDAVEESERNDRQRDRDTQPIVTHYDALLAEIEKDFPRLREWARSTSEQDLLRVATDIFNENDPRRLSNLLQVFHVRQFPLDPEKLFPLAQHHEGSILAPAIGALEEFSHPAVRRFALEMIERGHEVGRMVGLLEKNFEPGDWQLIESLTTQQLDIEDYHSLGMSIEDVLEKNWSQEASKSLLNLYEYCPCSNCRRRFVEKLHQLSGLPDWMVEECRYDANYDLREKIKNGFEDRAQSQ